jgi:hypothetical protein
MDLAGIGTLTLSPDTTVWHLRYARCEHVQVFPRDTALNGLAQAEHEVGRYYATCLTCKRQADSRSYRG